MPLCCSTLAAAPCRRCTKAAWLAVVLTGVSEAVGVVAWLLPGSTELRRLPSDSVLGGSKAGVSGTPIWRDNCLAIRSDRPPGLPDTSTENCWSSMSVPMFSWALSSMPDFMVASRMLLSISRMNSDSNCLAASWIAAGSFCPAWSLRLSSDLESVASWLLASGESAISDHLQLRVQGPCGLDGLQNGQQVLRGGTQRVQGAHHIGQLRRGRQVHDDAPILLDLDIGFLGADGLAARQGIGLADPRGRADGDRQVAVREGARAQGHGLVEHDGAGARVHHHLGGGHVARRLEVGGVQAQADGVAVLQRRGHRALDLGAARDAASAQVVDLYLAAAG